MRLEKFLNCIKVNTEVFWCAIVVLLITFVYPDWVFFPPGPDIDGFCYLGMVFDPIAQRNGFPNLSFPELIPVFWPQHIFYNLFSPLTGRILFKCTVVYIILILTFKASKNLFSRAYGYLAIFFILMNAYFLPKIADDYPTGTIIFYLVVIIYLVVKNSTKSRPTISFVTGFSVCCMISSALLTCIYGPAIAILYYGLKKKRQNRFFGVEDIYVIGGITFGFILFSLVSFSYSGPNFYLKNNFARLFEFLGSDRSNGPIQIDRFVWMYTFDIILFYSVFSLLFYPVLYWNRLLSSWRVYICESSIVILSALAAGFGLAYLQIFRHQETLFNPWYFNQIIPFVTLGLTAIVSSRFGILLNRKAFTFLLCGVALFILLSEFRNIIIPYWKIIFGCTLLFISLSFFRWFQSNTINFIFAVFFCCGVIVVESIGYDLWSNVGWLSTHSVNISNMRTGKNMNFLPKRDTFNSVNRWMELINKINPDRRALLWYDVSEPFGIIYRDYNLAAFFWQERLINEQLPLVNVPDPDWHGPRHIKASPGQTIIIITNFKNPKLSQLNETLAQNGMRYDIVNEIPFESGPLSFDVVKIKLYSLSNSEIKNTPN